MMEFNETVSKGMSWLTQNGAFLTTSSGEGVNTMTISWGFIGVMWGKPHFITAVRPQRHTKKIIEGGTSFTVSVPWGTLKKELGICGTQSGADMDKGKVVAFVPSRKVDAPVVDGCQSYFECKIDYKADLDGDKLPEAYRQTLYDGDYHTFYFGEIVEQY
jgi:flavin reductase (DIM6/NTAB) family NADH-FMN oxidoreductase RutF